MMVSPYERAEEDMSGMTKDELKGQANQLIKDARDIIASERAKDMTECSPEAHGKVLMILEKISAAFSTTVCYITNGQNKDIAAATRDEMTPVIAKLREDLRKDTASMQPEKKARKNSGLVINGKPIAVPEWETIRKNWVFLCSVVLVIKLMGLGGCSQMTPSEKQEAIAIARQMLLQQGVSATEDQQPRDQNIKVELQ
jgi:hypothetical protein